MSTSGNGEDPATSMYRRRTGSVITARGDGPPVVFSHGTLMDRTMFRPQLDALSDDYRCIAYDSRARTDQYATEYDLFDLADDCAAVLDATGVDSCVLVGMSMGGFMGLRFAREYPERLEGLVLVDSIAGAHSESDREQYGEMIRTVKELGEVPDAMADVVKHELFGETTLAEREDLAAEWVARWRTYPGLAVHNETASWLHRPDYSEEASEIDVPVLSVHGEEDVSLAMAEAEATVDAIPDARLEPIPEAGHSSNLENPGPVNDALREFLGEIY